MEFIRKGGGVGFCPIPTFEALFCASKIVEILMKIKGYGYFWALFLKGLY